MRIEPMSQTLCVNVTVNHPQGLHLRVGKDLVHVANQFTAQIAAQNITRQSPVVDAKSILQLMQLQARQGHIVQISAAGPDAQAALDAMCALLETADATSAL
ncbi:MAG: HPr family phosphocarrier protein [Litorilinea sp.]